MLTVLEQLITDTQENGVQGLIDNLLATKWDVQRTGKSDIWHFKKIKQSETAIATQNPSQINQVNLKLTSNFFRFTRIVTGAPTLTKAVHTILAKSYFLGTHGKIRKWLNETKPNVSLLKSK